MYFCIHRLGATLSIPTIMHMIFILISWQGMRSGIDRIGLLLAVLSALM